jgi:YVTN family beta-propeller protein
VANVSSNNVSVIDIATNTVVATIPVGLIPVGVAITPDGTRAYVINAAGPCLIIFCTTIWHKSV